jgi:TfoX/Sxy family transcriptional regulator of competence genes
MIAKQLGSFNLRTHRVKEQMAYDEETAKRIRTLLADRPDVVEKKMMGGLSFMVQDRMCCAVSGRGGLLVRVSADAHASMLAEPHVRPADIAGRTMTGFVRVGPHGYRTDRELLTWVKRGIDFAAALPPEGGKRKSRPRKTSKPSK